MIRTLSARLRRAGAMLALLAIVGLGALHGAHGAARAAPHAVAEAVGVAHRHMAPQPADTAPTEAARRDVAPTLCCATPPAAPPAPLRNARAETAHAPPQARPASLAEAPRAPPPRTG